MVETPPREKRPARIFFRRCTNIWIMLDWVTYRKFVTPNRLTLRPAVPSKHGRSANCSGLNGAFFDNHLRRYQNEKVDKSCYCSCGGCGFGRLVRISTGAALR